MIDLIEISKNTCLICRDNLFDISERDSSKKYTLKEYKVLLNPIVKLDCGHYFHIDCLKTAILSSNKLIYCNNLKKNCPYCNSKIDKITSFYNQNKKILIDKKTTQKFKVKENNDSNSKLKKKNRCSAITSNGHKCKFTEEEIGSNYCKMHIKKLKINEEKMDTFMYSNVIEIN